MDVYHAMGIMVVTYTKGDIHKLGIITIGIFVLIDVLIL